MLPHSEQENQTLTVTDEHFCRAMFIVTTLVYESVIPLDCTRFSSDMENFEYAVKLVAGLLAHFGDETPNNHVGLPFKLTE